MPIFFSFLPGFTPCQSFSTMKVVIASVPRDGSTVAKTTYTSARPALVMNVLEPLRMYRSTLAAGEGGHARRVGAGARLGEGDTRPGPGDRPGRPGRATKCIFLSVLQSRRAGWAWPPARPRR